MGLLRTLFILGAIWLIAIAGIFYMLFKANIISKDVVNFILGTDSPSPFIVILVVILTGATYFLLNREKLKQLVT